MIECSDAPSPTAIELTREQWSEFFEQGRRFKLRWREQFGDMTLGEILAGNAGPPTPEGPGISNQGHPIVPPPQLGDIEL